MQGGRENRECNNTSGHPFDSGFRFDGSKFPTVFGGNDPFDDPFFARPFGNLFVSSQSSTNSPQLQHTLSKGPKIEELDGDDEGERAEKQEYDGTDAAWRNKNPLVEHPEDQTNDHGKSFSDGREVSCSTNQDEVEAIKQQPRSVSFQRVTYGGISGAYYTATTSRRTANDGVTVEESRQADRTTGQATHRISRGLHDKGHSVTRKLDSDGKVDTVQTLHNLNEDELAGFEQAWRSNGGRLSRGWSDEFEFPGNLGSRRQGQVSSRGVFVDPFREHSDDPNLQAQSSRARPKKVVTINIE